MNPKQLLEAIIRPALACLGSQYCTQSAVILLLATAAQESLCGEYVGQVGGPALGIFQMEPATYQDTLARSHEPRLLAPHYAKRMVYDMRYATQMARLKYWLAPDPLPAPEDMCGMWQYYKRVWNTALGDTTMTEFYFHWREFVRPNLMEAAA